MTTELHTSKYRLLTPDPIVNSKKISLFSPLTLLVLLAIVFTFFLTASGKNNYAKNAEAELTYKTVMTSGDAIKSVLQ